MLRKSLLFSILFSLMLNAMEEAQMLIPQSLPGIGREKAIIINLPPEPVPATEYFSKKSLPADIWRKILEYLPPYSEPVRYIARYIPISNTMAHTIVDEIIARAHMLSCFSQGELLEKITVLLYQDVTCFSGYYPKGGCETMKEFVNMPQEAAVTFLTNTEQDYHTDYRFSDAILRSAIILIQGEKQLNTSSCLPYRKSRKYEGASHTKLKRLLEIERQEISTRLNCIQRTVFSSRLKNRHEKEAELMRCFQDILKNFCNKQKCSERLTQFFIVSYHGMSRDVIHRMINDVSKELQSLVMEDRPLLKKMSMQFLILFAYLNYCGEHLKIRDDYLSERGTGLCLSCCPAIVLFATLAVYICVHFSLKAGDNLLFMFIALPAFLVFYGLLYWYGSYLVVKIFSELGYFSHPENPASLADFKNNYLADKRLFCKTFIVLACRAIKERERMQVRTEPIETV